MPTIWNGGDDVRTTAKAFTTKMAPTISQLQQMDEIALAALYHRRLCQPGSRGETPTLTNQFEQTCVDSVAVQSASVGHGGGAADGNQIF